MYSSLKFQEESTVILTMHDFTTFFVCLKFSQEDHYEKNFKNFNFLKHIEMQKCIKKLENLKRI